MSKCNRSDWLEAYLAYLGYRLADRRLSVYEWEVSLSARTQVIKILMRIVVAAVILFALFFAATWFDNPDIMIDGLKHLPML